MATHPLTSLLGLGGGISPMFEHAAERGRAAAGRARARAGRFDWPRIRGRIYIVLGTVVAVLAVSQLPARQRGSWPAIALILGLLVLVYYQQRGDVHTSRVVLAVIPLAVLLGLCLASTPLTRGPGKQTAKLSTTASMFVVVDGSAFAGGKVAGFFVSDEPATKAPDPCERRKRGETRRHFAERCPTFPASAGGR